MKIRLLKAALKLLVALVVVAAAGEAYLLSRHAGLFRLGRPARLERRDAGVA